MKMLNRLLIVVFFLIFASPSLATTIFVDGNLGADCTSGNYSIASRNCSGSDGNAWNTLAEGFSNHPGAGHILSIRTGSYVSPGIWGIPSGTSFSNAVTIQPHASETVTITHGSGGVTVAITTKSYVIIGSTTGNIIINASGASGAALKIEEGSHHVRAIRVETLNNGTHGIHIPNGVFAQKGFNEIIDCHVHNGGTRIDLDHGLYLESGNNLVQGCRIHDHTGYGIHRYNSSEEDGSNDTIRQNRIYNQSLQACILIASGDGGHKVYGNIVGPNCGFGGITLYYGSHDSFVFNNTFYNVGLDFYQTGNNHVIANNLFSGGGFHYDANPGSGHIAKFNCYTSAPSGTSSGTSFSNNLSGAACTPGLLNPAGEQFSLTTSSNAINAGTASIASGVTRVFNGSAPDIGAHETLTFGSCSVESSDVSTLRIVFNTNVYPPLGGISTTGFTYRINGGAATTPNAAVLTGNNQINLTLQGALAAGNTIDFSYATTGTIRDSANIGSNLNQRLNAITNQQCVNNLSDSIITNKTTYTPGETITATVNGHLNGIQEWAGVWVSTNPDSSFSFESNWKYLQTGTQTVPTVPPTYPTVLTFPAPSTPGTYNLRFFREDGVANRLAISTNITVLASQCTHYADPAGSGGTCTFGSPCQVNSFWAIAQPGNNLCLKDGVYQGANSMINPTSGLSGVSGNPITIGALNDGQVRINGQGVRYPILLINNGWLIIQGVNVHAGSADVVRLNIGSHDNIIRRVVAWDANDINADVVSSSGTNNLFEDVGAFGVGRKVFGFADAVGGGNTCRRCWGRWEGSTNVGPKDVYELIYNNATSTFENVIGTWDNGSMPSTYTLQHNGTSCATLGPGVCGSPPQAPSYVYSNADVNQPYGVIAESDGAVPNSGSGVFGSIGYVKSADKFEANAVVAFEQGGGGFTFENVVSLLQGHTSQRAFVLNSGSGTATNLTSIATPTDIFTGWSPTNNEHSTTVSGASSIYTGGVGADVCNQYINRKLTVTPLWPWPMNQRILDATTFASQAGHQHLISLQGLVTDPHAIEDVTASIQSLFGTIPAQCVTGGAPSGVTITSPTSNPTLTISGTANNGPTLSGTSSQVGGSLAWSCDRCGSGSASGVASWTSTPITLKSGVNIITVTGTDGVGNPAGSDIITITFIPTFPGNSLVGAWAFEEGAGTTSATDSSGNSNTGTLTNAPTRVAGRHGQAIQFNGTTQFISVADSNSLDLTHSFTISAWVQPLVVATNFQAVLHKNALPLPAPYDLYARISGYCGSGGAMGLVDVNGISGPWFDACSAVPLPTSTWTHLATTYDGATLKLYKNGALLTTTIASGFIEPSNLALLIGATEFGEFFQGILDEVRLYNWALPTTAGSNLIFGDSCASSVNKADAISNPSIVSNANCPIIPLGPPLQLKIGPSSTSLQFGPAAAGVKFGSQ